MRAKHVVCGLVMMLIAAPAVFVLTPIGAAQTGTIESFTSAAEVVIVSGIIAGLIAIIGFIDLIYGLISLPIETVQELGYDRRRRSPTAHLTTYACPSCGTQIAFYSPFCPNSKSRLTWQ